MSEVASAPAEPASKPATEPAAPPELDRATSFAEISTDERAKELAKMIMFKADSESICCV